MPRAGDEAYVEYVNARMIQLRRTAYLLCGDWSRGDDLVQRTLTDVYRSWPKARRADNLDAYVRTIMVHRFIDDRRRAWSRVTLVESVPETVHPESAEAADTRIDVRSALAQLPPQQRAVLVLRFLTPTPPVRPRPGRIAGARTRGRHCGDIPSRHRTGDAGTRSERRPVRVRDA